MIAGNLNDIDFKIKRLFKEGGDNVYGLGATLEGFDVNPLMYEFVFDQAWDYPVTTDQWITNWSMCRGGKSGCQYHQSVESLASENLYRTCHMRPIGINERTPQTNGN